MIRHEVLIKLRPDVPGDEVERALRALRALALSIPGVVRCRHACSRGPGSRHALLVVELASRRDLADYLAHPAHSAMMRRARPLIQDVSVVDYEVKVGEARDGR